MKMDELIEREFRLRAEEKLRKQAIKKISELSGLLAEAGLVEVSEDATFCPFCGGASLLIGGVSLDENERTISYFCTSCKKKFKIVVSR
jgi:hypothetical protein